MGSNFRSVAAAIIRVGLHNYTFIWRSCSLQLLIRDSDAEVIQLDARCNGPTGGNSTAASHSHNYSISSVGHNRNVGLGSAAAHFKVPQSPSQPTVALNAPPSPALSVITDDHSPTSARIHNPQPSDRSPAGFPAELGYGPGQGSADRGKIGRIFEKAGSNDDDNNNELEQDESDRDHPAKGIKKRL
ncbi:hypothetical protein V8E36_006715 [Tilletia maclaganii]